MILLRCYPLVKLFENEVERKNLSYILQRMKFCLNLNEIRVSIISETKVFAVSMASFLLIDVQSHSHLSTDLFQECTSLAQNL